MSDEELLKLAEGAVKPDAELTPEQNMVLLSTSIAASVLVIARNSIPDQARVKSNIDIPDPSTLNSPPGIDLSNPITPH